MTATDELRRMLDERGVHWWAGDDERKTLWESNGLTWEYFNDENGDAWLGFLGACEQDITPEQAIAATLGSERTCTNGIKPGRGVMPMLYCSNCGCYTTLNKPDNATSYGESFMDWPFYCGNCGSKVVSA